MAEGKAEATAADGAAASVTALGGMSSPAALNQSRSGVGDEADLSMEMFFRICFTGVEPSGELSTLTGVEGPEDCAPLPWTSS